MGDYSDFQASLKKPAFNTNARAIDDCEKCNICSQVKKCKVEEKWRTQVNNTS